MRFSTILLGGLSLVAATPAFAQDSRCGYRTALADHGQRQRRDPDRLSPSRRVADQQERRCPAALTVAHESGFYIGTFASNLAGWGTFGGANMELDGIAGYKHTYGTATVDAG